jgi:serine/threonine protein kinase
VSSISRHHDAICETLFGTRPAKKVSRIGLYDIIDKIGQSDDRVVYLGSHRYIKTKPKTVLKVHTFDIYASVEEKERQIEAIFHDQNAMRMLGVHPNIIDTGDIFAWEDNKFVLPTEYVDDGRPLAVILAREEDHHITWGEKAKFVKKLASALRHCHKHGVIHRDVKPQNVVISPKKGDVKLVNFDLALIRSAPQVKELTDLKERMDKRYVAPEVWKNPRLANEASDVYSLGVVFYELITSKTPANDVEGAIKTGKAGLDHDLLMKELGTKGSEDFMDSPADAAGVIEKMCEVDPAKRYKNMEEVFDDLSILSYDEPRQTRRFDV